MRSSIRLRSTFPHRKKKWCGKRLMHGFAAAVNSMACLISTQWYATRTTPHNYCRRTTAETICTSMMQVTSRKEMRFHWCCSASINWKTAQLILPCSSENGFGNRYSWQLNFPALRQNSIHLYFQQLRLSFSQPKFSRSKFDPRIEGSVPRLTNN